MSQNNSNDKAAMLAKIEGINEVEGFDPTPFAVDYTDLETGEVRKRLPVMIQMAWFRMKYPEGRIAITVLPGKDCFVATAKVYPSYKDGAECYLAEATASRGYLADKPSVSPREWAQTAAVGIALRNAGFGLQFAMAGDEFEDGNYAIKTPHHSFVSGLSEHTVKPPMADEILEYDGRYWTTSGKRLSYMRDKTQDERYFILTLFAIAKELEDTGRYSPVEQIQLAVGLPPEHYGVLKDKFARYFKRDGIIRFVYKDKPYSIMIDKVMVFPQAYAAVVPKSSMVVNMLRVFVVDIGGYTTDVLLLKNGKPDLQFCRSLETGIITMNNEIIRKVGALHDMRIEDEHISAVLSGQDTILPDDVKQTICGATKLHAQDILNQLRELQVDLRSNPAVFIGGGSLLLRPFLEASPLVAKADFVESPNANALGYEMLGRVQLSHRPA